MFGLTDGACLSHPRTRAPLARGRGRLGRLGHAPAGGAAPLCQRSNGHEGKRHRRRPRLPPVQPNLDPALLTAPPGPTPRTRFRAHGGTSAPHAGRPLRGLLRPRPPVGLEAPRKHSPAPLSPSAAPRLGFSSPHPPRPPHGLLR